MDTPFKQMNRASLPRASFNHAEQLDMNFFKQLISRK